MLQAGTNVVSASDYLNVPTNRGTSGILELVSSSVGGSNGADLQFAAPAADGVTIVANGTNWTQDYIRFHS
jgi:hypothetical protein